MISYANIQLTAHGWVIFCAEKAKKKPVNWCMYALLGFNELNKGKFILNQYFESIIVFLL